VKSTLKTYICFMLTVLLLSTALVTQTQTSSAASIPYGCISITISQIEVAGSLQQTWPAAPTGEACIALRIEGQSEGQFKIIGGWVFNAPLSINGEIVPTHITLGELAAQINPVTFQVPSGNTTVLTIEPAWNPIGTEIGFGWQFRPTIVYTEEMSFGTRQIKKNWVGIPGDIGKLVMLFPVDGTVVIQSGWTFDSGITMNGAPVETFTKQGEASLQIKPFSKNVRAGESWVWTQNMANANAELSLSVAYSPKRYLLYLPLS